MLSAPAPPMFGMGRKRSLAKRRARQPHSVALANKPFSYSAIYRHTLAGSRIARRLANSQLRAFPGPAARRARIRQRPRAQARVVSATFATFGRLKSPVAIMNMCEDSRARTASQPLARVQRRTVNLVNFRKTLFNQEEGFKAARSGLTSRALTRGLDREPVGNVARDEARGDRRAKADQHAKSEQDQARFLAILAARAPADDDDANDDHQCEHGQRGNGNADPGASIWPQDAHAMSPACYNRIALKSAKLSKVRFSAAAWRRAFHASGQAHPSTYWMLVMPAWIDSTLPCMSISNRTPLRSGLSQ